MLCLSPPTRTQVWGQSDFVRCWVASTCDSSWHTAEAQYLLNECDTDTPGENRIEYLPKLYLSLEVLEEIKEEHQV